MIKLQLQWFNQPFGQFNIIQGWALREAQAQTLSIVLEALFEAPGKKA